jgi:hypothetical protein
MRAMSLCLVVCSLILNTGSVRPARADDVSLPVTATPRLAVVKDVSNGSDTIVCAWGISKPTLETITREIDGRVVTEVRVAFVTAVASEPYSLAKASFYDAEGGSMSREAFLDRARPGTTIVISGDERPVDRVYLRTLKSDVLVLVPSHDDLAAKVLRKSADLPTAARPAEDGLPAPATPTP